MPSIIFSDFISCQLTPVRDQKDLLRYTAWLLSSEECLRKKCSTQQEANTIFSENLNKVTRFGVSESHINSRQIAMFPEKFKNEQGEPVLPLFIPDNNTNLKGYDLKQRMAIYDEEVMNVIDTLFSNQTTQPLELIHATCSGYLSPSPAQKFLLKRAWNNTRLTHSYHMGCYAAIPTARMALGAMLTSHSLGKDAGQVDVVHTELLSLHFDATRNDAEHIVNMSLFADGFIKYSVYVEGDENLQGKSGFKILACEDELIPNSAAEMTWIPNTHQFDMTLSKHVPSLIQAEILPFISRLTEAAELIFSDIKDDIILALHPGGPKIIDYLQDTLGLTDDQLKYSRDILKRFGNMSSSTIPHIWKEIVEDDDVPSGKIIVSIAFGPGLTAAGLVIQKI